MTIVKGQRVARTKTGIRHIADKVNVMSVDAMCGQILTYPHVEDLLGSDCPECDRAARALAAGE